MRNPYALDRSPCGSSSGTGAGISANVAAAGIGTETDGSILCPAAMCGLVGLKPTVGLVSRAGIVPIAASQDTAGPMCRTVADAAILVLPHAQREGVEIRFELDRVARWVRADAVQVQQVLINLIKNAIEAMQGKAERRIVITTGAAADGAVEVAVADSGAGLDADQRAELFTPFSSSKAEGLGVGLSISRTIVEAHGGRLWAEKNKPHGARFIFTLPIVGKAVP